MSEEPQRKKLKSSSDDDNKEEEQCAKLTVEKLLKKIEEQKSKIEEQKSKVEEQNNKIEEQTTIIAERDTKIEKAEKNMLEYAIKKGLPPVVDTMAFSPYLKTGHEDSEIVKTEIVWPNPGWENASTTLFCHQSTKEMIICSEGDVVGVAMKLIRAVMLSLRLENYLRLHVQVSILDFKADILVFYAHNNMMPIGSFEVKTPKVSLTRDNDDFKQIYGQIYDQMHTFRLGGPETIFSVLTNYNEWQLHSTSPIDQNDITDKVKKLIQCLDDVNSRSPTKSSSNEKAVASPEAFLFKKQKVVDHERENDGGGAKGKKRGREVESIINNDGLPRQHYSSQVIEIKPSSVTVGNDTITDVDNSTLAIVNLIATALVLMLDSAMKKSEMPQITNKPLIGPTRGLVLDDNTCVFAETYMENGIDFDESPDIANQKKFRIWLPVGFGETGTCCLATGEDKAWCCVIKFYSGKFDHEELAKNEVSCWNTLYGTTGQNVVAKVAMIPSEETKWLAVIPYIHPIPKADRDGLLEQGLNGILGAAFLRMAKKGIFYEDDDVCWRHVGYTTSEKLEIRLCDLAHLIKIDPDKEIMFVEKALAKLKSQNQEQIQSLLTNHLLEGN